MQSTSVRIQAKGQVTIPKAIRDKLKVEPGDLVVFIDTEDGVLVKPAAVMTDESLRQEVTTVVRAIRERFADYTPEEIEALVDEAINDARKSQT